MRKSYLLAGSFGLLGAMAQLVPAFAAPTTTQPNTAAALGAPKTLVSNASNLEFTATGPHTLADVSKPNLLAVMPQAASTKAAPVAAAVPQNSAPNFNNNLIAQDAPAPVAPAPVEPAPAAPATGGGAPVTSVSQLSDVQPGDWAFQALQSLIERYGCIAGYPDGTYRGNRALTRYEFAAGTYACLNSLAERLGSLSPEDLATIRRLQEEFAAELATLRGRVDALEARTTELEANQFSTTTKLQGEVVIAGQYGEQNGAGRPTAIARARLNFNTSFSGNDLLQTQLELGNGGEDLIGQDLENGVGVITTFPDAFGPNLAGAIFPADLGSIDYSLVGGGTGSPILRRLAYTFKVGDDLAVTFGPRLFPSDFVDFNSYANNSAQDFSSGFFINNPLIITNPVDFAGGAGAAFDYNFGGGPLSLRAVYVAASPTNALPNTFGGGLFGDPYQATAELEFSPSNAFALRLQYTNATTNDLRRDAYGANVELTLADRVGLFGRYGYGEFDSFGEAAAAGIGDFDVQTFMAGIAIRDFLVPGSLLGFAYGQPYFGNDVDALGTQRNYEAFYRFAISDNITVTPAVMVITDPNNGLTDAGTIYQGVLRTTFSF
ncbi:Putative porin; major outer membrane protein [uncultured Leptolyngbya sp.]|uniref:Porin major outer membrane protein n=2 Tax=Cyanophyceae TaxID=3028117 RepID=A0A6J4M496_9CYAN|nr:Putative porin; major outer membrane protein [uncultured Leptolyngbya sp.]CAA9561412.1 Putative porin; major outer membrane protein [uncultured Synechococcales cyanobacterium]